MRPALSLLMIVSLAGPSNLGPYTDHTDAAVAAPSLSQDVIRREASAMARDANRSPKATRAGVRDNSQAAHPQQGPLTRGERVVVGVVLGSLFGAVSCSTVGQEGCPGSSRSDKAAYGAGIFGTAGALAGWLHR